MSKIFADLVLDLQGKWFGAAENCGKPQETAGNSRKSQEAISTPFSRLVSPNQRCPSRGAPGMVPLHNRRFISLGCTPRGSCNRTLRRVLRRFSKSKCFLEGFLEGAAPVRVFSKDKFLRRVLRRERFYRRRLEGA